MGETLQCRTVIMKKLCSGSFLWKKNFHKLQPQMRMAEQSVGDHSTNERAVFCQFVFCVFLPFAKCKNEIQFLSDLCHVPPPFLR